MKKKKIERENVATNEKRETFNFKFVKSIVIKNFVRGENMPMECNLYAKSTRF